MSTLVENSPRIRDDSQVRALALGSKACKEIKLSAENVDWERFLENVAREYRQGRTESEIDWKTTVSQCAVRTASSFGDSWLAGFSRPFALNQLPALALSLAVVVFVAWLIFFRAENNSKERSSEFLALQQETRSLREENAKLQGELEQAKLSIEKSRQDLTGQQRELEQKIVQLERENRAPDTTARAKIKPAPQAEQLALNKPLPSLLSELEATGQVTPTEATRAARQALDSRDTRETLRSARSEQRPIPLSPRFTAVRSTIPTLRWEAVTAAREYQVRVVYGGQKGDTLVWQSGVLKHTQTALPSGLLHRGKVYFWQVEALVDGKPHLSPAVGFWVISDGALREVEATERQYRDSVLALSAMYEAHGLYEEALAQVEKLSNKNKNLADLAQDMRRRLHLQLEKE